MTGGGADPTSPEAPPVASPPGDPATVPGGKAAEPPPPPPPGTEKGLIVRGPPAGPPVVASRRFTGPHEFPPEAYKAYGILAFPALATPDSETRHLLICRAYIASLPPSAQLAAPPEEQMVTTWPIADPANADFLNDSPPIGPEAVCRQAVENYDLPTALTALAHARSAGAEVSGRGPYLVAWSPAEKKGDPDALVLRADLSAVTTTQQALNILRSWRRDIEQDPSLWDNGWNLEKVRLTVRSWADRYGSAILAVF